MSLAAIGIADMDWQDDRSSVLSVRSRGLRFPMAASFALHLGIAICLLSGMSPRRDAVSTGDPNAIEVTIVRLQKTTSPSRAAIGDAVPPGQSKPNAVVARVEAAEKGTSAAVADRSAPHAPSKPKVRGPATPQAAFPSSLPSPATSISYDAHPYGAIASPAAAAGAADSGERIFVTEARYRSPPTPPHYPKRARDLDQQGEALVRVRLDDEGNAEEILIWKSSGFALLDNAALAAVRRWQFEPARRNGMPTIAWVQIPVRFSLN